MQWCMLHATRCAICYSVAVTVAAAAAVATVAAVALQPHGPLTDKVPLLFIIIMPAVVVASFWSCHCETATTNGRRPFFVGCHPLQSPFHCSHSLFCSRARSPCATLCSRRQKTPKLAHTHSHTHAVCSYVRKKKKKQQQLRQRIQLRRMRLNCQL